MTKASLFFMLALLAGTAHAGRSPAGRAGHASEPGIHVWLSVSGTSERLSRQPDIRPSRGAPLPIDIRVDTHHRYQSIMGFGAAMTDASALLIEKDMTARQREALLRELFGTADGIGLNMLRLTIGASDFSPWRYSLDGVPKGEADPSLAHFSIARTRHTVVPAVREAMAINPDLRVMASPWSPPAWMKTSDDLIGGTLLPKYQKAFARYLVKYVDAYERQGIPIYALTLQNEPGFSPGDYPGMKMAAATRARIIARYLGPALARRRHKTLILDWDHNWNHPEQPLHVLSDPAAARYVGGVAWHCYEGDAKAQTRVHEAFPDKPALMTECSDGEWEPVNSQGLVWMTRNVLIASLRNWARGVLLWNLALDKAHGPHLGGCGNCIGVVTIDHKTGRVVRTRDYYALAHFSRFVKRGAVRVASSGAVDGVSNVAFLGPDRATLVLVAVNDGKAPRNISVHQADVSFRYRLPPLSVATFVWRSGAAR